MASRKERKARQELVRIQQATQRSSTVTITGTAFQGPMPPPEMLAEYDRLVPNGAERIFSVFEKQVDHRIDLEKVVVTGNEQRANRGLYVGGMIGIVGLLVAGVVAATGHEFAGVGIAATDLVSLVSVFVYGTNSRRAERQDKAKVLARR